MTSLIGSFMRDLPFLRRGLVPMEESGAAVEELNYGGEAHEKLTDQDVSDLTEALLTNDAFRGKVDVQNNDLSDLAALHLSKLFAKTSGYNVTQLKLGGNRFTSKAGEYLGEAISSNPNYPIKKVSFKGVCLELIGLTRMVQACNANSHIKKLEIGYLTDTGLRALAEQLVPNVGLEEIIICETEDSQKLWTAAARTAFVCLLKDHTKIKKVFLMSSR